MNICVNSDGLVFHSSVYFYVPGDLIVLMGQYCGCVLTAFILLHSCTYGTERQQTTMVGDACNHTR